MSEPTAIEILEWLAHKADFAEASIAFGAGGWRLRLRVFGWGGKP